MLGGCELRYAATDSFCYLLPAIDPMVQCPLEFHSFTTSCKCATVPQTDSARSYHPCLPSASYANGHSGQRNMGAAAKAWRRGSQADLHRSNCLLHSASAAHGTPDLAALYCGCCGIKQRWSPPHREFIFGSDGIYFFLHFAFIGVQFGSSGVFRFYQMSAVLSPLCLSREIDHTNSFT